MHRAVRLQEHFLELQGSAAAMEDLLNQLSIGVFLCEVCGRIQMMNQLARDMVLAGDGLSLIGGCLVPGLKCEADRLDGLLAAAAAMANGGPVSTGGALSVSRPSGRRAYTLAVAPYSGKASNSPWVKLAPATRVVIFIADPELRYQLPEDFLVRLYGLTAAEARMAELLAGGRAIPEISERLGITRETARSRLKAIFSKTDTHSQAQLVSVLSASLPMSGDRLGPNAS